MAGIPTRDLHRPRPHLFVIRASFRLAAKADDIKGKRHCLKAVLQLDPENEPASLALLVLDERRPES